MIIVKSMLYLLLILLWAPGLSAEGPFTREDHQMLSNPRLELPPIDQSRPAVLETATFALG